MKAASLFLAAALIAVWGTAPLLAQGGKAETKRYKATGQVTVINEFTGQVTIKTTEIPGLEGKTMTVAYMPKDKTSLAKLKEGDKVVGDLVVTGLDTYMENVKPAGAADAKKDSSGKRS
jgi:Cu/Ag efflux protein CusF